MRWAPEATQSHLQHYQTHLDKAGGLDTHSGLALATESLMHYAELNNGSITSSVSVSSSKSMALYEFQSFSSIRGIRS